MSWLSFFSKAVEPVTNLIDSLHTSDQEQGEIDIKLKALGLEFAKLQNNITAKAMEYESKILEARTSIIVAEANGSSWLQTSWRPITMLTFLALIILDSFGWLAVPLNPQAWTLLQLGLSGYIVGRTVEKGIKEYKK